MIRPELHERIRALATESQASVFMVLHAAFATLLTRLGAGTDIPIGSPIAGRTDDAVRDLVGFFVNTLVLRVSTAGEPSFAELLARVAETDLAAYAHQEVPFERIVEVVNPTRSLAHHPLFQVLLALQNATEATLELPGLAVEEHEIAVSTAKYDLSLMLTERPGSGGIDGFLGYDSDLFDRETALAVVDRFVRLLTDAVENPGKPIAALDILAAEERHRLLVEWNGTGRGAMVLLPDLFEAQVSRTPDRVAVVAGGRSHCPIGTSMSGPTSSHITSSVPGCGQASWSRSRCPARSSWWLPCSRCSRRVRRTCPSTRTIRPTRIEFMLADAAPAVLLTELPAGVDGQPADDQSDPGRGRPVPRT